MSLGDAANSPQRRSVPLHGGAQIIRLP